MMDKDTKIERLTSDYIHKLGWADPSDNFTDRVMNSIALQNACDKKKWLKTNWWMLTLAPFILIALWYVGLFLKLPGHILLATTALLDTMQPLFTSLSHIFGCFRSYTISPLLLVGFTAMLLLLTIDEIIGRIKRI